METSKDEGPQSIDLEELGGDDESETVRCTACGAEVYEDAERCPQCGHYTVADAEMNGRGLLGCLVLIAAALALIVYLLRR